MTELLKKYAPFIVVLLLVVFGSAYSITPPARASSQGCVDVQSTPVLQHSGWHVYNSNYSDFTTKYEGGSVIKSGNSFIIYVRVDLNNSQTGIFRGTSTDGRSWKLSTTPVLPTGPKGSWDELVVFSSDVVWNGTGYMMYYVGDGVTNKTTFPANFRQIGVAFSPDGIHWSKYAGNPIITHGPGLYDARYTRGPSVIFDNGTYKMWYTGTAALNYTNSFTTVDYATSSDGVHWTKYQSNPVFTGYRFTGNFTEAGWPSVIKVNGSYVMAFSDSYANVGLATSHDGISWKFSNQSAPLLTLSGWHNGFVSNPSLLLDGQRLLLWYFGVDNSSQKTPYVGGIGMSTCGILVAAPPMTTTNSVTTVYTVRLTSMTTSISTSTRTSTQLVTVVDNPTAPIYQVATAAVVGAVLALAVAASLVAIQVRRTRQPRPA
ncbi:MAG TPA: hypothetical protein VGR56_05530 [Nitrososphaerales archaeon]|nr:hypothetical protein [Nitrososphaerales archaeon]